MDTEPTINTLFKSFLTQAIKKNSAWNKSVGESSGWMDETSAKIVYRGSEKQLSTTPLNSVNHGKSWQHPCTRWKSRKLGDWKRLLPEPKIEHAIFRSRVHAVTSPFGRTTFQSDGCSQSVLRTQKMGLKWYYFSSSTSNAFTAKGEVFNGVIRKRGKPIEINVSKNIVRLQRLNWMWLFVVPHSQRSWDNPLQRIVGKPMVSMGAVQQDWHQLTFLDRQHCTFCTSSLWAFQSSLLFVSSNTYTLSVYASK